MREFERFNTVCANAFVKPLMASYLDRLVGRLTQEGTRCPVFMIHSGGGIISVESAIRIPGSPARIRPGRRRDLRGQYRQQLRPRPSRFPMIWAAPPPRSA